MPDSTTSDSLANPVSVTNISPLNSDTESTSSVVQEIDRMVEQALQIPPGIVQQGILQAPISPSQSASSGLSSSARRKRPEQFIRVHAIRWTNWNAVTNTITNTKSFNPKTFEVHSPLIGNFKENLLYILAPQGTKTFEYNEKLPSLPPLELVLVTEQVWHKKADSSTIQIQYAAGGLFLPAKDVLDGLDDKVPVLTIKELVKEQINMNKEYRQIDICET